jgi:hypothetical protein
MSTFVKNCNLVAQQWGDKHMYEREGRNHITWSAINIQKFDCDTYTQY